MVEEEDIKEKDFVASPVRMKRALFSINRAEAIDIGGDELQNQINEFLKSLPNISNCKGIVIQIMDGYRIEYNEIWFDVELEY